MPLTLLAQREETHELKFGSNSSLKLPVNWVVTELYQGDPPQSAPNCETPGCTQVLLAASSNTPGNRASITIYQTSFTSIGLGIQDEGGKWAEMEKLLCGILSQGYTVDAITSSETNLITFKLEVYAHNNTTGEYRTFTQITYGRSLPVVRAVLTWDTYGNKGYRETVRISHSIRLNEKLVDGTSAKVAALPTPKSTLPTPKPTPLPPAKFDTGQFVAAYSDALIIVEGKEAVGSGFVCNMDGHNYLFTNAHVVCASPSGFKLTTMKGAANTVGASAIAVGHDIVRMEVQNAPRAFDLLGDLETNAKIGDEVMVSGNMNGGMVVHPVEGKILGIGPNLVEVDAPFEPGNSGSPIIHKASGKVIGIATYLLKHKVEEDGKTVSQSVRRFGYRLDSVKTWEPINWPALSSQATAINRIELVSNDFIRLFNAKDEQRFNSSYYKSPIVQRAIYAYANRVKDKSRQNVGEWRMAGEQLLGDLRAASKNDIISFDMRNSYDYLRREMQDQLTFRDDVYKGLSRVINERH
ncbi:MAG: serine protease [Chthoniobacteraceae bacterium]